MGNKRGKRGPKTIWRGKGRPEGTGQPVAYMQENKILTGNAQKFRSEERVVALSPKMSQKKNLQVENGGAKTGRVGCVKYKTIKYSYKISKSICANRLFAVSKNYSSFNYFQLSLGTQLRCISNHSFIRAIIYHFRKQWFIFHLTQYSILILSIQTYNYKAGCPQFHIITTTAEKSEI